MPADWALWWHRFPHVQTLDAFTSADSKVRDYLMELYDEDWSNRFREQRFVNGTIVSLDHSKKQPKVRESRFVTR